ncbi:MAG: DNA mismatch repair endonuclease MutL [Marinilabilia sp.]
MSDIIQLLPDSVANQIAAGEVIQRPASIIKELGENAIDAGSTDIQIIVKDAGRTLVQIIDNGCGMTETDARMAFERHATSKIRNANDLFAIRTMGFRGEALASIAAVARIELKTRPHEQEVGTHIAISGSKTETQEPVACSPGSQFLVRDLFFNVPARRRFLKTNATELRHIVNEFQRLALANPEIAFSLTHNDQLLFKLPPANLRQRIAGVIGKQAGATLLPIESNTALISIKGFIGKPESAKKTMGDQFFFINNRFMRSPYLHKAVTSAYENLIPADHSPPYFIFFGADPGMIDVNIHPTKTEIKFEDERSIWKIVNATLREALGKFNMVPSIDFDQTDDISIPTTRKDGAVSFPTVNIDPDYNPFETGQSHSGSRHKSPAGHAGWEALYEGFEKNSEILPQENQQEETIILPSRGNGEDPQNEQTSGFPAENTGKENGTLYFQIKNKYIITSVKSGVMIINQRRAHERILFEAFLKNIQEENTVTQSSLFPEKMSFNHEDTLLIREIIEDLKRFGFELQEKERGVFTITGQPSFLKNVNAPKLIDAILEAFKSGEVDTSAKIREQLAGIMARNASIRPGEILSQPEMAELINKLFLCSAPNYSPSGKTVFSILGNEELEKRFK